MKKTYKPANYTIPGFLAAATKTGIRGKDRLDMGLIFSQHPAVAAGVYTTSQVKAAPVLLGMESIQTGSCRAILVNSGVANACSGDEGMAMARFSAGLAASHLGLAASDVQVCSTGVIGMQLEKAWFAKGVPALHQGLQAAGFVDVAQAIMTTDTVPKLVRKQVEVAGKTVTLLGMAKGAGMIMPNMATMLAFIMSDAAIEQPLLQQLLSQANEQSFNVISVDGDTSTNDTVLMMANGQAGNEPLTSTAEAATFAAALAELMKELALMIVADGEGATKLITIKVAGAASRESALQIARTIANSALFKTACYGEDANWGRIFAAAGRAGVDFDQHKTDIFFDGVQMVQNGLGLFANEEEATKVLKQDAFTVRLDLHSGEAEAEVYTCDLSHDYVTINGDYRT